MFVCERGGVARGGGREAGPPVWVSFSPCVGIRSLGVVETKTSEVGRHWEAEGRRSPVEGGAEAWTLRAESGPAWAAYERLPAPRPESRGHVVAARAGVGRAWLGRPLRAARGRRWRLRPHHPEGARSRQLSEAKQGRAWLVLGRETAWEYRVP